MMVGLGRRPSEIRMTWFPTIEFIGGSPPSMKIRSTSTDLPFPRYSVCMVVSWRGRELTRKRQSRARRLRCVQDSVRYPCRSSAAVIDGEPRVERLCNLLSVTARRACWPVLPGSPAWARAKGMGDWPAFAAFFERAPGRLMAPLIQCVSAMAEPPSEEPGQDVPQPVKTMPVLVEERERSPGRLVRAPGLVELALDGRPDPRPEEAAHLDPPRLDRFSGPGLALHPPVPPLDAGVPEGGQLLLERADLLQLHGRQLPMAWKPYTRAAGASLVSASSSGPPAAEASSSYISRACAAAL